MIGAACRSGWGSRVSAGLAAWARHGHCFQPSAPLRPFLLRPFLLRPQRSRRREGPRSEPSFSRGFIGSRICIRLGGRGGIIANGIISFIRLSLVNRLRRLASPAILSRGSSSRSRRRACRPGVHAGAVCRVASRSLLRVLSASAAKTRLEPLRSLPRPQLRLRFPLPRRLLRRRSILTGTIWILRDRNGPLAGPLDHRLRSLDLVARHDEDGNAVVLSRWPEDCRASR